MDETIFEALRESHTLQRKLCRRLLRTPPDTEQRREALNALRIELAAHAAAEERFLYAPILMDDRGLSPSRHALAEHHEIDEFVEALAEADPHSSSWLARAQQLCDEVHHHLREEERKFFQMSGKILSEPQKQRLALRYRRDYRRMQKTLQAG